MPSLRGSSVPTIAKSYPAVLRATQADATAAAYRSAVAKFPSAPSLDPMKHENIYFRKGATVVPEVLIVVLFATIGSIYTGASGTRSGYPLVFNRVPVIPMFFMRML